LLRLGESKRALVIMQERQINNNALYLHVLWSPAARTLRALPEFKTFTQKTQLVDLWERYGAPDACRRVAAGDYDCAIETAATR
jgi:hypothetical protein